MDEDAGGEGAGGEAGPAQNQAYAYEKQKRAKTPCGLIGVHERERDDGGDGGEDHGADGPLGMVVLIERGNMRVEGFFDGPVEGGTERGKKKAAENYFLKKGRKGDAECE